MIVPYARQFVFVKYTCVEVLAPYQTLKSRVENKV